MADYIERKRLKEAISEDCQHLSCFDESFFDMVMINVDNIPAADVRPVVHARWVEYKRAHYFKCSSCKKPVPYRKAVQINGTREYNFCPYCGAQMDGGKTDDAK